MITRFGDARDWFFEKRFGMFVHWGLYALPAWHEQILWRGEITRREYETLPGQFNPVSYDPERWLDAAESAGMEYLCFTKKHHDGFCMWDTQETDYNVMNTPYGRDVLAMLADACERRGILLCLYYSLPDWHHRNYPNQGRHHEMFGPRPGDEPDAGAYLEFVRRQVRELLTGYGPIHAFFWDVNVAELHDPSINDMIRELQPQALINDRGPGPGDYSTPERHVPPGHGFAAPTEACQSMGRESWGYRADEDYYSRLFLMQSVDRILAMGGNYLLNVGPMADGTLPKECVDGLERIGRWYEKVSESFRGTVPASHMLTATETHLFRYDDVLLTRRDNTFYVHAPAALHTGGIVLDGLDHEPESVVLLNDGRRLDWTIDVIPWRWKQRPCLRLRNLPVDEISDEVLVARIEFGHRPAE